MKRSNASMTHKGEGGKEPAAAKLAATKPAAAKPTAAKPTSAKWVVPSFFHTKQFMRHFLDILPIDMLMTMRALGGEWLEVTDTFIDGKVESGVMMVHDGDDMNWVVDEERRLLVTQAVFLLNITKVGSRAFMWADNLVVVEIPEGIESIGSFAFQECPSPGSAQKTYNAMSKVVAHLRSQPQP
ncbi:hypothetical protein TrVE_jg998 [Triparma verrucosa]|uniref:Uncharacterized protein n=1 Tax=Triparma verrucosa TaxID=1606542 RepID=A0A9W7BHM9_9STRA|nr:hypothetical protein TrVE_jg998 [Triparma verrucosa]